MSYYDGNYYSNHKKSDFNHQNSFKGYHYGSEFSNYGTNSYNTNCGQPDMNAFLSNGSSHSNRYGSNYTTNPYNTNRGQPDLNRFLSNRSSHSNHYGSNFATTNSYNTNRGQPDLNMPLSNRSSHSNRYGSNYATTSYNANHGRSDVNMLNDDFSSRNSYCSNFDSNSYIKKRGNSNVNMKLTNQNDRSNISSSSSTFKNVKNTSQEDLNDSFHDISGEIYSSTEFKVIEYLCSRFPKKNKEKFLQLIKQKRKLKSPFSLRDFEMQKTGEGFRNGNNDMKNSTFFQSLQKECRYLKYFKRPGKQRHKKIFRPMPKRRWNTVLDIKKTIKKRHENLSVADIWEYFRFFLVIRENTHAKFWDYYHKLFKIVHFELQLEGPFYYQKLRDAEAFIRSTEVKFFSEENYEKASEMYAIVSDPPLDQILSLLVLAWRYLIEKNFLWFATVPEIMEAEDILQYKAILLQLEERIGYIGMRQALHYVDTLEVLPESLGKDKFVENPKISDDEEESSDDLSEKRIIPNKDISKSSINVQNFEGNMKNISKKQSAMEELSRNWARIQRIDASNISDNVFVIQIKQFTKLPNLHWKNSNEFSFPLRKSRKKALKQLKKVFVLIPDSLIIRELSRKLCFFANPYSGERKLVLWRNYQKLSKIIYMKIGLGKGPEYVARLIASIKILETSEFQTIPEDIYDELLAAYNALGDSAYKEIETLILLAKEYLEEKKICS